KNFHGHAVARARAAPRLTWPTALGHQLDQRIADALACDFHEAEFGHRRYLRGRPIFGQARSENVEHAIDVGGLTQMNKVDDDQPADSAQTKLPADLVGSLEIDLQARFLESS